MTCSIGRSTGVEDTIEVKIWSIVEPSNSTEIAVLERFLERSKTPFHLELAWISFPNEDR